MPAPAPLAPCDCDDCLRWWETPFARFVQGLAAGGALIALARAGALVARHITL